MILLRILLPLLLIVPSMMAVVSWDGYVLSIEQNVVRIKYGAEYVIICHISKLAVIEDKLVVEIAGVGWVREINAQTKQAIMNEITRNSDGEKKSAK